MKDACVKQNIQPGQLTVHADLGSAMTCKTFASLLADLGVAKILSRRNAFDDNPYSVSDIRS